MKVAWNYCKYASVMMIIKLFKNVIVLGFFSVAGVRNRTQTSLDPKGEFTRKVCE